jgi:hypothetical protein
MPFDPNKYLAAKPAASGGFNPDSYLNTKKGAGIGETIARHGLQGLTFNFSDDLAGVGAKIGDWFASKQHGLQTNPNAYTEGRDEEQANLERTEAANPGVALASQFAGGLAVPLPGVAGVKAATTAGKIAKGAAVGAGSGALAGAGSAKEMSDIPESAAVGGLVGGTLGGAIPSAPAAYRAGKTLAGKFADKIPKGKIVEAVKDATADKAASSAVGAALGALGMGPAGAVVGAVAAPMLKKAAGKAIRKVLGSNKAAKAVERAAPEAPPPPKFEFSDEAAAALERPRLDAGDVPESVYADPTRPKTIIPKGDLPPEKNLGSEKIYVKPPRADISNVPRATPDKSFDEMVQEAFQQQDAAKARQVAVASDASDAKIAEIKADGPKTGAPLNLSIAPSRPLGENEVDVGIRSLLKSAHRDAAAREASGIAAPATPDARSLGSQLKSILGKPQTPGEALDEGAKRARVPQSDDDLAALLQASLKTPKSRPFEMPTIENDVERVVHPDELKNVLINGKALEESADSGFSEARVAKVMRGLQEGKENNMFSFEPVRVTVTPKGKMEVDGGRHRIVAARRLGIPIKVRFQLGED